jgi:hypothetical protein
MPEELYVCVSPNGTPFKCVASQLQKCGGNDPFGRPLSQKKKDKYGVD